MLADRLIAGNSALFFLALLNGASAFANKNPPKTSCKPWVGYGTIRPQEGMKINVEGKTDDNYEVN